MTDFLILYNELNSRFDDLSDKIDVLIALNKEWLQTVEAERDGNESHNR